MRIATSADLVISADTMHQYVTGPATLKKMMHILSDDLERGAQVVYPDAMKARVRFHKDITLDHMDTIIDYRPWHQYITVDQCEDVEELDFHGFLSHSDV